MLLQMARQLERGEAGTLTSLGLLSGELQAVMNSRLNSKAKSTTIAELVPTITGMRLQSHQFAAQIMGPLFAMAVLLIAMHVLMLTVVPQFTEIFTTFGVEMPWMTATLSRLSNSAGRMGIPGLICSVLASIGMLATGYALLVWPRTAEIWEAIPILGLSVRWLMQARVARILGVLIRNQAPPDEAIAIASEASGFQSVAAEGKTFAARVRSGTYDLPYSRQLSGLPLSLLFRVSEGHTSEPARQETAQAFLSYASALEQASSGNGSFLALVFEMFTVIVAGFLVGFVVLSLFLPLIRLLNALA
jgi:type II secretory pathway component PulF